MISLSNNIKSNCMVRLALLLLTLSCSPFVNAAYEIKHLQPHSWWVGMHSPSLQLLVHGDDIAQLTPAINYAGVSIDKVHRTDNPNYLFIDLTVAETAKVGSFDIVFSHKDKTQLRYPYQLHQRRQGSAARQGFSPKDAIYLITPDRFANGDTSNDSVEGLREAYNRSTKGGRHGGDIQGVIDHLNYIDDMGFTQIWLNPVLINDMADHSYHGYATTDFYQIDPRYGSNELYQQLSDKALERGMGLIMDVILNHSGSNHWWMQDFPTKDWINNGGEFSVTNHRRETLHDIHAPEQQRTEFSDGWFVPVMPDLNQRNPFMANYLIQNNIWWIEYANLSGLRIDTYSYSDKAFLTEFTQRVMAEYPNINMVGEEWSLSPNIVAYWQRDTQRHDDYQSELPSVMDFPLQHGLVQALTQPENWNSGLIAVYLALTHDFLYGHPDELVTFVDNHDMSRIYTQLNENLPATKMAMAMLFTLRGTPQVFYGTEILMANPGTDDHGIIRSDFAGGWQSDVVNAFNGNGLSAEQTEMQAYVKALLNWRKTADAIHHGKLIHYIPQNGLYVYFRQTDKQTLMVVVNRNNKAVTLERDNYAAMLSDFTLGTNVLSAENSSLDNISAAANAVTILELKK